MLRYWTGWQQPHEHLANKTEVPPTVLPADGSGVPYSRRAVNCRCARYLAGARSGFRSGCGQPLCALREQPWEEKRGARVGHHHGGQTCTGYRGYRCDCQPGLGPGGTLAIDLETIFLVVLAGRVAVAAIASHTCVPPSVSIIITKLAEFRVQTAARVNKWVPTVSEGVCVFVAVETKSPVFSEGSTRAEGERRPLERGGSSVLNEALTRKISA